jgi:hypothetical protein
MEPVVMATTENQDWQDTYNTAKDGNPSANIEYLPGALYFNARLWILATDDLCKIICKIEHDSKVASHIGQDKTIKIIKRNFFWLRIDKYIEDFIRSCESS